MESGTTGEVLVTARIENLADLYASRRGLLPDGQVRQVEVDDALVDAGATMLSLPSRLIDQLGLKRLRTRRVRTPTRIADCHLCEPVRLTIQGRDFTAEVAEIPDVRAVLIGRIPLTGLDFVVDPVHRRLIGNPEHGGKQMIDCF